MRRMFACLALLASTLALAGGPEDAVKTAQALRDRALAGSTAYAITESLTTEVGPRLAGTGADARAVAWAQAKFRELGFDKVYLEPVTFPVWRRGHETAQVLAPYPQPLVVTALGDSIGTGDAPVEAEVVQFPDLAALEAVDDDRVRGKIAFIANRMDRTKDGSDYGKAVPARSRGAVAAAKKGAVAVLIRSIGTGSDRFAHTGMMRYEDGTPKVPAAALSNPDADLLTQMLRRGEPVRLRLALDVGPDGEYTSHNVIGEITGRELADEVVLIGGHLDSWDLGTGAVDDAAGIAITMAAAALIGELDTPPRRTVRVVAFANEEQGIYGANQYAQAHAGEVDRHVLGAESDFGADRIYALRSKGIGADLAAAMARVLEPLGIAHETGDGDPGADIGPMTKLGMPYVNLAQDGTRYFDLHHTANDTLDKVDAKALDQQVAAYAAMAYLAAQCGRTGCNGPP
ncbi:MAG TPA: M28 family peptidase [Xanthomonadaceae bacterium]|nr:M28 family peptidase [Xanthomonadaceae bacterium]